MRTIYTNCPEAFDGFSTRTAEVVGQTDRGPLRRVECDDRDFDWQMTRYLSGGVFEVGAGDDFPAFLRRIGRLTGEASKPAAVVCLPEDVSAARMIAALPPEVFREWFGGGTSGEPT
jgi:hypothetical protein